MLCANGPDLASPTDLVAVQVGTQVREREPTNPIILVVVDEPDPSIGVVGMTGQVTEWKSKGLVGAGEDLDLPGSVCQSGPFKQVVDHFQVVLAVEEDIEITPTAGRRQGEDVTGILRVAAHPVEGTLDQGESFSKCGFGLPGSTDVGQELRLHLVVCVGEVVLVLQKVFRGAVGIDVDAEPS